MIIDDSRVAGELSLELHLAMMLVRGMGCVLPCCCSCQGWDMFKVEFVSDGNMEY